jgi:hypothetical protein
VQSALQQPVRGSLLHLVCALPISAVAEHLLGKYQFQDVSSTDGTSLPLSRSLRMDAIRACSDNGRGIALQRAGSSRCGMRSAASTFA